MYSSAEQSWAEEKNINNFGNGLPLANSADWPIFAGTEVKNVNKEKGNLRKLALKNFRFEIGFEAALRLISFAD